MPLICLPAEISTDIVWVVSLNLMVLLMSASSEYALCTVHCVLGAKFRFEADVHASHVDLVDRHHARVASISAG